MTKTSASASPPFGSLPSWLVQPLIRIALDDFEHRLQDPKNATIGASAATVSVDALAQQVAERLAVLLGRAGGLEPDPRAWPEGARLHEEAFAMYAEMRQSDSARAVAAQIVIAANAISTRRNTNKVSP